MFKKFCCAILAVSYCASIVDAQGVTFAFDLRGDDHLFSFPTNDPTNQTPIGPEPVPDYATFAMDFNTAGDTLWVVDHIREDANATDILRMGTVDKVTGAFTPGADLTDAAGALFGPTETGLSVDPTDETFYLSRAVDLHTVDPNTGIVSLVGAFSGSTPDGTAIGTVIDIAVDASGDMFAFDIGTDSLWSVDKTSGAATYIASPGLDANFAQGMDFDPTTNTLYSAIYTGGGTGSYGFWDTTTGDFTEVIDLPSMGSVELEMAIMVPEPTTGCLALLCMLGFAAVRRR